MTRSGGAASRSAATRPRPCCRAESALARTPGRSGAPRAGSWTARGPRVPARNVLLANVVPAETYGRAYGFERAMDNLGAIVGPLLAIGSGPRRRDTLGYQSLCHNRTARRPAIVYAIRHTTAPRQQHRQPIRLRIRPVLRGHLGRLMVGITAFEIGNCAATLLILRATELFDPGRSDDHATQLAILLYVGYNVAATFASIPAGHHGDRHGARRVLAVGAACFAAAYLWFAYSGPAGAVAIVRAVDPRRDRHRLRRDRRARRSGNARAQRDAEAPLSVSSQASKQPATSAPPPSRACSGRWHHPARPLSSSPAPWSSCYRSSSFQPASNTRSRGSPASAQRQFCASFLNQSSASSPRQTVHTLLDREGGDRQRRERVSPRPTEDGVEDQPAEEGRREPSAQQRLPWVGTQRRRSQGILYVSLGHG